MLGNLENVWRLLLFYMGTVTTTTRSESTKIADNDLFDLYSKLKWHEHTDWVQESI